MNNWPKSEFENSENEWYKKIENKRKSLEMKTHKIEVSPK